MKSDLELAIESSKTLESLLERNYSAMGRGLHEKTNSVSDQLTADVIRDLRFIATVRNEIVHEQATQALDRSRFTGAFERLIQALSTKPAEAEVKPSVPSMHIMCKETPDRTKPHFWDNWDERYVRVAVAVICALAGMAIAAKSGNDIITSLFIAGVAAFCGYWFGHVLAGVAILGVIIVAFLLLFLVWAIFKN